MKLASQLFNSLIRKPAIQINSIYIYTHFQGLWQSHFIELTMENWYGRLLQSQAYSHR